MNTTLLKTSIALAVVTGVFAGPASAQKPAVWNDEGACTLSTLRGGYGYTSTGTLLPAYVAPETFLAGPFAEVGRQTFDGMGNTKAIASLSANGNPVQDVSIYGTYVVHQDCTGSMTLVVPALQATVHADFVIDHHGTEIRAIVTDANLIESRVYRKQFKDDQ